MKAKSEEAQSLDQFLSDMSEVFDVPKRKLAKMVHEFDDEPKTVRKDDGLVPKPPSKRISSPPRI